MSIVINLGPEDEARVRSEARLRGLAVDEYVRWLVDRALEAERPSEESMAEWEALAQEVDRSWPKGTPVLDALSEMRR